MSTTFRTRDEVDFVVIGSGAAGSVMARELSVAGFKVVVLEQGPYLRASDHKHDEWAYNQMGQQTWANSWQGQPQTARATEAEVATIRKRGWLEYRHALGGSNAHFSGNYWRLRPNDFRERSLVGPVEGTGFDDWPITYDELEPYYTRVDWEIGLSGVEGPSDPPRSKGYPCPPMPVKSPGVLLEKAGKSLGLNPYPAPVAILSKAYKGRPPCIHCGFCLGYTCEVGAKSTAISTMIPEAEATGNCEIRADSTVFRIDTNEAGRVTEVVYWDRDKVQQAQRAKAVVVCANGAETPRLLLQSESPRHPNGLANSSGVVGRYLNFNSHAFAVGTMDQPVNGYRSIPTTRVIHDYYETDLKRGFVGGGGIDARAPFTPILFTERMPGWGHEYKQILKTQFDHGILFVSHGTSMPVWTNSVSLDPTAKDLFGRPAIRVTFTDHPNDLALKEWFMNRNRELMEATGAKNIFSGTVAADNPQVHLLGTCRMGNDPQTSVIDKYHRTHDVPNLFLCDGSSLVTSTRGQPTMTIQALAFRASEHMIKAAKNGEI